MLERSYWGGFLAHSLAGADPPEQDRAQQQERTQNKPADCHREVGSRPVGHSTLIAACHDSNAE